MRLSTLYFTHALYLVITFIAFSAAGLLAGMAVSNKPFQLEEYWAELSPRTIALPFKTYFPLSFTEFLLAYSLIALGGTLIFTRRLLALFGQKKVFLSHPKYMHSYTHKSICTDDDISTFNRLFVLLCISIHSPNAFSHFRCSAFAFRLCCFGGFYS